MQNLNLKRKEAELEAERDAIRLEGVNDCAEIIPMVLPDLDMGPIHAAIRFCKGEISQEEFQRWLPPSPAAAIGPDLISAVPALETMESVNLAPASAAEVPFLPEENRIEVPVSTLGAISAETSQPVDTETVIPSSEAEPTLLSSDQNKDKTGHP